MSQEDLKSQEPEQDMIIKKEPELKHLEFVQVAATQAVLCFANLYVKAKDKSGPLKPGVDSVEGTVKNVVGPIYYKFHDVPLQALQYVDTKVDESMANLNARVPPSIKQASAQALAAAQNAPAVARSIVASRPGVVDTAKSVYTKYEPTAKDIYAKYEPKAEECAVSAWRKLNQIPLFPRVAQVVVPSVAYCSEKYNETILEAAEKGYKVSSYLPLVPTDRIAKVFSNEKVAMAM